jgi:23S rRNA (guanosine2251-2'-O)-methyltransferase
MKSSRNRKWRQEDAEVEELLIVSGRKPVLEVLRRGLAVSVQIADGAHGTVIEVVRAEARKRGVEVRKFQAQDSKFQSEKIPAGSRAGALNPRSATAGGHPALTPPAKAGGEMRGRQPQGQPLQGVSAVIRLPEVRGDIERLEKLVGREPAPLLLMLDGIEDPANFGAILRTAYAAGVDGVVFRERRQAPLNEVVFKTSAGCAALIDLYQVTNLDQAVRKFQEMGYWIAAAQGGNQAQDYSRLDWNRPSVLIMGSEGRGVSELLLKRADDRVEIPMYAPLDSLNVGAATAVLLFEAARQRGLKPVSVE